MKVCLVLPVSLETPSGLRYAALAGSLARRGHRVSVLALHHDLRPTTLRREERSGGYQVHYVGQMHVRKVGSDKHYFSAPALMRVAMASAWKLAIAAAREPCDLLHLGKPQPINGLAGLAAARLRGRPLFVDCDDYEAESNRFAAPWQKRVVRWFEDGLPRVARGLTTNTRFMEARLVALGARPERIAYVPNGIDEERFAGMPAGEVEALRRLWELPEGGIVGYIGTLSLTNHAVDLLLEAFGRLHARHPGTVLLAVGGGEDLGTLRQMAAGMGLEKAVRFVGRVAPAQAAACYALCQVSVDPVRDDLVARSRSPLKIVESLAAGTPVVTGDVGDRREMLADGKAGILVAPGDAAALAEGLEAVLFDPGRRRALAEGAPAACAPFRWSALVERVEALYRGCLGPTCC